MGLYRKAVRGLEKQIVNIEIIKNRYSESKAIKRKRPIYDDITWSAEEEKKFEDFWTINYGKSIPKWWHKLYQSVNKTFNEQYFPDELYSVELEWRVNPRRYSEALCDKNLLQTMFRSDDLHIPKTFISCTNGVYQDGEKNVLDSKTAMEIASNVGEAVIKPTVDSCSGSNVRVVSIKNGADARSGNSIKDILPNYGHDFVIQELIVPCDEIKALSPNSLSTLRVMTFITDEGIFTAPLAMRVGTGNSDVDNIHAGGLGIGVNNDGKLKKYAYRLGYGDSNEKLTAHPDSGIVFENYQIPMIPEMLEMAKRCHARLPMLGILSWDFTVDKENMITLIEVNTQDQAVWFPQMVNGKPVFGDNTPYFLNIIKKK